ncbi:MAG TPA: universal stress protein, partial [Armatimonadota bacterium]|nr:universal stress protein [Armatimonadota bacterium]
DEEGLLERRGESADEEFSQLDKGPETPHDSVWLGGPPVDECVREIAKADFGVVGKSFRAEPTGGSAIGSEVSDLKQRANKPLIIVPKTVRPVKKALFVFTEHPESGHAMYLAGPLSAKGVSISLLNAISPLGRNVLTGAGAGYLKAHDIPFDEASFACDDCALTGGPAEEVLRVAEQEEADLIVVGGTRRGFWGELLWPELAREVVWNAKVPVLIWY